MIVSTCSFGSTGSSVVTDYLKEYDNIHVIDKIELPWIGAVDGLVDLDYHLNFPHGRTSDSIYAIERYKNLIEQKKYSFEKLGLSADLIENSLNTFINSIVMTSWKFYNPTKKKNKFLKRIALRFTSKWQIKNNRVWEGYPYDDVYFSVRPQNFDEAAKKHINDIMCAFRDKDDEILVFDQLFSGNNPQCCFKYIEDPYAIVVDRDPRDVYVFGKTHLIRGEACHIMPLNNVKDFVVYYKALRHNQPYKEKHDRILCLRFEDLVYNYDKSTKRLQEFLHLPQNPNPKTIFDPSLSIANTQVWKRTQEFDDDIKYIERELNEYLFDFSKYPSPPKNGKMFCGKSPKNR